MRLLNVRTLQFVDFFDNAVPDYAILSHTWGEREMSYQSFTSLLPPDDRFAASLIKSVDDGEELADLLSTYRNLAAVPGGLVKIVKFCQMVGRVNLDWAWVDSCCINKESSAELSEAINSMYNWYKRASICWAYLVDVEAEMQDTAAAPAAAAAAASSPSDMTRSRSDTIGRRPDRVSMMTSTAPYDGPPSPVSAVSSPLSTAAIFSSGGFSMGGLMPPGHDAAASVYSVPYGGPSDATMASFRASRWFTRGWTLQELLAPAEVKFFDRNWHYFGTKSGLSKEISEITGIRKSALLSQFPDFLGDDVFTAAEKMSWAADRETTRPEDIAYSLLGLFGVTMSLQYGEGHNAFLRLQKKIMKTTSDETLFAWDMSDAESTGTFVGLLAPHPRAFLKAKDVQPYWAEDRPISITPRGAGITILNPGAIRNVDAGYGVFLPFNCVRDKNIIGVQIARLRGVWYRVNRSVGQGVNIYNLGHSGGWRFLDDSRKDVFYVSLMPMSMPVKINIPPIKADMRVLAVRLASHVVPESMKATSLRSSLSLPTGKVMPHHQTKPGDPAGPKHGNTQPDRQTRAGQGESRPEKKGKQKEESKPGDARAKAKAKEHTEQEHDKKKGKETASPDGLRRPKSRPPKAAQAPTGRPVVDEKANATRVQADGPPDRRVSARHIAELYAGKVFVTRSSTTAAKEKANEQRRRHDDGTKRRASFSAFLKAKMGFTDGAGSGPMAVAFRKSSTMRAKSGGDFPTI